MIIEYIAFRCFVSIWNFKYSRLRYRQREKKIIHLRCVQIKISIRVRYHFENLKITNRWILKFSTILRWYFCPILKENESGIIPIFQSGVKLRILRYFWMTFDGIDLFEILTKVLRNRSRWSEYKETNFVRIFEILFD